MSGRAQQHTTPKGTKFSIDGYELSPCFTPQTSMLKLGILQALIEPHADELLLLAKARDEKIKWNYANPGQGRNWPEFSRFERLFKSLQKHAGINDT